MPERARHPEETDVNREEIADRIIEDHTLYAAIGGSVPVPLLDVAAVTAIQIDLVHALSRVYEVPFDPALGKALVASVTGASAARLGASVVKALPGVGTITGGIAQAGLSGASTYAVGRLFRRHFAEQGTLADLDADAALPAYRALLAKGREAVTSLRPTASRPMENVTSLLERLAKLRDDDVISVEEFEQLKSEVIAAA
jgi:uncharacterized protein (DUF697 family)